MASSEARPPVWIGHVAMPSTDVRKTTDFLLKLGLRPIEQQEQFAVLELRGGTHLVVLHSDTAPGEKAQASFDLMYEDVDAVWKQCEELGFAPSEMKVDRIHRSFLVTEPGGHKITINSTHVSDLPV